MNWGRTSHQTSPSVRPSLPVAIAPDHETHCAAPALSFPCTFPSHTLRSFPLPARYFPTFPPLHLFSPSLPHPPNPSLPFHYTPFSTLPIPTPSIPFPTFWYPFFLFPNTHPSLPYPLVSLYKFLSLPWHPLSFSSPLTSFQLTVLSPFPSLHSYSILPHCLPILFPPLHFLTLYSPLPYHSLPFTLALPVSFPTLPFPLIPSYLLPSILLTCLPLCSFHFPFASSPLPLLYTSHSFPIPNPSILILFLPTTPLLFSSLPYLLPFISLPSPPLPSCLLNFMIHSLSP